MNKNGIYRVEIYDDKERLLYASELVIWKIGRCGQK
jgi:hypothetical protein